MDETIRKGEVIGGKYRIEGVLGVGAMGIVYAAHHLQLDERVALKALRSELVAYPDAVKRFIREAQAAAKIKNEHVTRVFDVGQLSNGTPYIVMESLEGEDLARWLAARGSLRLEEAIAFVLQACEALAEAHALGIVHRDLKPSNLFCSRRPDGALSIKVLDFGISKIAALATSASGTGRSSGAKSAVGSPFYMSPEQMQSAPDVDHRTDIWALGVILFELLTTAVPFEGDSLPEICVKVATRPPRSLIDLRSDLPEEIQATITKCLEKDPDDRFESLAEFAGSLFPFAGKGARLSIERIVQVSRKERTMAAKTGINGASTLRPSERATFRPLGATVPPPRVEPSGHLTWLGLGGAAAVALGVVFFWTRPIGNGLQTGSTDPAPAANAAAQPAPQLEPSPKRPEPWPKADEPRAADVPFGNVALEAPFLRAPVRPAATEVAPAKSGQTITILDEVSESKQQRHIAADATVRPRTPAKPLAEPTRSEPGVEMRRLRQIRPREIDETDPYAK
jgi:serine/threonine-protein kinase